MGVKVFWWPESESSGELETMLDESDRLDQIESVYPNLEFRNALKAASS